METPIDLDKLVLDAPAAVGGLRFGKGVRWSTVIAAAQRHHKYVTSPEQEKIRMQKAGEFIAKLQVEVEPVNEQGDTQCPGP